MIHSCAYHERFNVAPRHGDIVGPITMLLDAFEAEATPSHAMAHACFPQRVCAGLFHRAPESGCIAGLCPEVLVDLSLVISILN
jgi:hypothetical protein